MKRPTVTVVPFALILLINAPCVKADEAHSEVADLVAKMPADSIVGGQEVAAEIVKLGPDGLSEVLKMLVPPGTGNDSKARFAANGLAYYVTRPDAEAERRMYSEVLLRALDSSSDAQVKTFLINMLQLVGKEESVAPLSKLLQDPELCEPATQALVRINTKGVIPALMKALPGAEGKNLVTLVHGLGDLRAKAAVKAILPYALSEDVNLRHVALYALANIGALSAADALAKAAQSESPYERAYATELYLAFARRLAETRPRKRWAWWPRRHARASKRRQCTKICRDLIRTRTAPRENNVICDALAILVVALKKESLADLLTAVDSGNDQVREAALKLTGTLPGKGVTAKLVAKMKQAAPEVRAALVDTLGRRGDRAALPGVLAALKDAEKPVRLAAVEAAARFTTGEAVAALLAAIETDQADEVKAVQAALQRIPGEEVLAAAAAALPKGGVTARVALLQILAARRASAHFDTVFAAATDEDASVRLAALKALGNVADAKTLPKLIDLMLKAPEGAEKEETQAAVVAVCRRIPEAEARAQPVLDVMAQITGANRALLLNALAQLGGQKALQAVVADTKSADAAIQEAAIQALAEWQDASAAPDLLDLSRAAKGLKYRVVALRGYIRLTGLPSSRPIEQTVRLYQDALAAAERPDEKRLVLGGLSSLRHIEALKLVATCLDDEAVAAEAAAAAVKIALPQKEKEEPLRGPEVIEVLKKAIVVAKDAEVRDQASAYLSNLPRPDEANLARGKPATTSVAQQGNQAPALAVDGNSSDPLSAWFGAAWPSWFRVDLEKPLKIDSAQVFFYWDGTRYYQYTVDASLDDKTWKTVVDMTKNTKPSTRRGVMHTFDPVEARYVRVNILKNSVNEAVHLVELKVYAAGTAPAPEAVAARPKPDAEGFIPLFNGRDLTGWQGSTNGYIAENGVLVCLPDKGGLLFTEEQYGDFDLRFEFKLTPNANNGIGIRFAEGNPAYSGMEIQVLDDSGDQYKSLQPYQYHGSIYGVVPCERGHQKPVGEWNSEEIIANGRHVTVILNGFKIVDADLDKFTAGGTPDHQQHPGLKNDKGFIGFLGHGSRVEFRNIRLKELNAQPGK